MCAVCGVLWPCDTRHLADDVVRQAEQLAEARRLLGEVLVHSKNYQYPPPVLVHARRLLAQHAVSLDAAAAQAVLKAEWEGGEDDA